MPRRHWTRRRGVFVHLAGGMISLGVLIGAVFPYFAEALGVPPRYVLNPRFWAACLGAGILLGSVNWLLTRRVIGTRLRLLAREMHQVGGELRAATAGTGWSGAPWDHRLEISAGDDLGRTAQAFNDLLAALEAEHRFRSLVQAASDVICLIDADGVVRFASESVASVLGWQPEQLVGNPVAVGVHDDDQAMLRALLHTGAAPMAAAADADFVTLRVRHADHGWRRLEISLADRRDDPEVGALVLTGRDITERYELQQRLAHQAAHDGLTGLPNRAALHDHGMQLLARAAHDGGSLSVVMMDLDRFKEINDTLGHTYGDRLLVQVAARLRALLRDGDLLARLGGDEFAVLMPGLERAAAAPAARRLLVAFEDAFLVDGLELNVEASIGVAVADIGQPGSGEITTLLREADIAMYIAKDLKTGVEVYDAEVDTHNRSRLVLLSELRRGLASGELELHYQPKVSLHNGSLAGVEALVRWRHPTRGLLVPESFLPVVEQTGLIDQLTTIVLDLALAQTRTWLDEGHRVQTAVNLSARCLHQLDFPDRVAAALARHDVPAGLLRLELTESALIADPAKALAILQRLHDSGVTLSIDDFGTGYSSMSYLKRLPVDELKVDRSFVSGMATSAEDAALVRSVVDLGHNLGLDVVAEGIEDASTISALAELRCDIGQGYHFARPGSAAAISTWLAESGTAGDGRLPAAAARALAAQAPAPRAPAAPPSLSPTSPAPASAAATGDDAAGARAGAQRDRA